MRGLALMLPLLILGCGESVTPTPTPTPTAAPTPNEAPASPIGLLPGVATDQPCTRSVEDEAQVADGPFRLQDLERMIPPAEAIPGLQGAADDPFVHGYHDNAELASVVPNPPSTCDGIERFGRLTGFAIGYTPPVGGGRQVLFAVHLFADAADAVAWSDGFFGGFVPTVGGPNGPTAFSIQRPPGLPAGSIVAEHVGGDGTRSWASVPRGPILAWVVDLHPQGAPTIDLVAAATLLVARIDAIAAEVATGAGVGPDAAHLLSAPLPLAAYGEERSLGLAWDGFFGGCADAVERGLVAGGQARVDAERFARVAGCTNLYAPPVRVPPSGTVRVFSSVGLHESEEAAAAMLSANAEERDTQGATRFPTEAGDEAVGLVTPPFGEATFTDTRVMFRQGDAIGVVAIQTNDAVDISAEVTGLAQALEQRMAVFLQR